FWGGSRLVPRAGVAAPPPASLTPALALTVFAASLSSLGLGFNIGVINAPQKVIEVEYNATWARRWGSPPPPQTLSLLWALSVAIFSVGGMGTALAGGAMAERLGRKGALLATNGLAVVGGALMGGAKLGPTYILIIIGRFIVGAYSGTAAPGGVARLGGRGLTQGAWSDSTWTRPECLVGVSCFVWACPVSMWAWPGCLGHVNFGDFLGRFLGWILGGFWRNF
uniref:Uncharacterized protein n=1 Tax=Geospiza parvula TaxID=87175 RepID=A0A8U8BGQ2_GEOPR